MRREQQLRREETLPHEEEEEERACLAAMPLPRQTPEEAVLAAYQTAFGWAGLPPVFIDLTDAPTATAAAGLSETTVRFFFENPRLFF